MGVRHPREDLATVDPQTGNVCLDGNCVQLKQIIYKTKKTLVIIIVVIVIIIRHRSFKLLVSSVTV